MAHPTNSDTFDDSLFPPFTNQEQIHKPYDFGIADWDPSLIDWDLNARIDQTTMSLNSQAPVSNPALGNTTISEGDMNIGNSVNPHEWGKLVQDIEQKMEDRFQDIQKKMEDRFQEEKREREKFAEMLTEKVTNQLRAVIADNYKVMEISGKAEETYKRLIEVTINHRSMVERKIGDNSLSLMDISDI